MYFSLKVVDRTRQFGRLIGIADKIRPIYVGNHASLGRRGILPIEEWPLGSQIWKLDFREHDVFLQVNKDISGLADRVRTDPTFYAIIFPEVIRRVLERSIFVEGAEVEEDSDRWPATWLRFGRSLHPMREDPPGSHDPEESAEWIEDVAEAFCDKHGFRKDFQRAMGDTSEVLE